MPSGLLRIAPVIALLAGVFGCSPKAGFEGTAVDARGNPIEKVSVWAMKSGQAGAGKQAAYIRAKMGEGAFFRFDNLDPQSRYILRVTSENWANGVRFKAGTGQEGTIIPLPRPLTIRFTQTPDGVIRDSATGLDWIGHNGECLTSSKAVKWTRTLKGGGGWHLPSIPELKGILSMNEDSLCQLDPLFGQGDTCEVWSNPEGDPSLTSVFDFSTGREAVRSSLSTNIRTFAVRVPR